MDVSTWPLDRMALYFRAFARMQGVWPEAECVSRLRALARVGGRVTAVRDEGRFIASMVSIPADKLAGVSALPGLAAAARAAGIDPAALDVWSHVFVAPAERARGVGRAMITAAEADASARGVAHVVLSHYAAPSFLEYVEARADRVRAGIVDTSGDPVYFLPTGG